MHQIYLFCAILGAAFVLISFVAMLFGMGGDADGDGGGFDAGGDSGVDAGGDAGDSAYGDLGDSAGASDDVGHDSGQDASFLRAFSIRSVAAGFAFFGLGGLAAESASLVGSPALGIAILCGALALVFVWRLTLALSKFNHNGSLTVNGAIGSEGVVYLTVPANRGGIGKVTIIQQERSVEYDAQTDGDVDLKTGEPIIVKGMLSANLALVARRQG